MMKLVEREGTGERERKLPNAARLVLKVER